LMKLLVITIKVMMTSGDNCMKVFVPMLRPSFALEFLADPSFDSHPGTRTGVQSYAVQVLMKPTDREDLLSESSMNMIEALVRKGVSDPTPAVRALGRTLYSNLQELDQNRAKTILESLEPSTQKQILAAVKVPVVKARPTAVKPGFKDFMMKRRLSAGQSDLQQIKENRANPVATEAPDTAAQKIEPAKPEVGKPAELQATVVEVPTSTSVSTDLSTAVHDNVTNSPKLLRSVSPQPIRSPKLPRPQIEEADVVSPPLRRDFVEISPISPIHEIKTFYDRKLSPRGKQPESSSLKENVAHKKITNKVKPLTTFEKGSTPVAKRTRNALKNTEVVKVTFMFSNIF